MEEWNEFIEETEKATKAVIITMKLEGESDEKIEDYIKSAANTFRKCADKMESYLEKI